LPKSVPSRMFYVVARVNLFNFGVQRYLIAQIRTKSWPFFVAGV